MHHINGMSQRQIHVYILMSLANKYPCMLSLPVAVHPSVHLWWLFLMDVRTISLSYLVDLGHPVGLLSATLLLLANQVSQP